MLLLKEDTQLRKVVEKILKSERKGNNRFIVSFLFTFQKNLQNLTKALAAKSLPPPSTIFAIFDPLCCRLAVQHVTVENCVEKALFRSLSFPPPPSCARCTMMTPQNPSDLCYWRGWGRNPPFYFHLFRPLRPDQPHPSARQSWLWIFKAELSSVLNVIWSI